MNGPLTPAAPPSPGLGESFPEVLRRATGIAALSPSSHNCQPWALARLESGRPGAPPPTCSAAPTTAPPSTWRWPPTAGAASRPCPPTPWRCG
ncbi:hypothetical protein [Streptomyces abikoensis]